MLKIIRSFAKFILFFDIYFYLNEIKQKILEENCSIEIDKTLPNILSINPSDKRYKKIKLRIEKFIKNNEDIEISISYNNENIKFFSFKEKEIPNKSYEDNIIVKSLVFFQKIFGLYVLFFIFSIILLMTYYPMLDNLMKNFLNREYVEIFSYSVSLALMLLFINGINYSFSLKIPIFFVMAIYAILTIFSSFIKYKIIGSYFPKIDFDPAIWIISCYLYITIFYFLPILSLFIYCLFLKISKFKIFLKNDEKPLIIESMGYTILKFFTNWQSRFMFNFFGFKDFESPKNNIISPFQQFKIKLTFLFIILNVSILVIEHDTLMKSYIYSHSSLNNSFCENLSDKDIIVKDLNKAFKISEKSKNKYYLNRIECK